MFTTSKYCNSTSYGPSDKLPEVAQHQKNDFMYGLIESKYAGDIILRNNNNTVAVMDKKTRKTILHKDLTTLSNDTFPYATCNTTDLDQGRVVTCAYTDKPHFMAVCSTPEQNPCASTTFGPKYKRAPESVQTKKNDFMFGLMESKLSHDNIVTKVNNDGDVLVSVIPKKQGGMDGYYELTGYSNQNFPYAMCNPEDLKKGVANCVFTGTAPDPSMCPKAL